MSATAPTISILRDALTSPPPLATATTATATAAAATTIGGYMPTPPATPPPPPEHVEHLRQQLKQSYEEEAAMVAEDPSAIASRFRANNPNIKQKYPRQHKYEVHVLLGVPLPSDSGNTAMSMASAYGKDAQICQLTKCFMELGIKERHVFWHAVSLHNIESTCVQLSVVKTRLEEANQASSNSDDESESELELEREKADYKQNTVKQQRYLIVMNMCDGTEEDGYPGISVVNQLEARDIMYTGSGPSFYHITTSKLDIKNRLIAAKVPTSPYAILHADYTDEQTAAALDALGVGYPLVLKPAISYASAGITVVWNAEQAIKEAARLRKEFGEIYAEMFIQGREFTVLITGDERTGVEVYPPGERCFNKRLPWHKQLLTFDLYWAVGKSADDPADYWYDCAPEADQPTVKEVAQAAYIAVDGTGYGRVDMRMDSKTGKLYVLEVNANCGFSESADSSMGSILISCKRSLSQLVSSCFDYAVARNQYSKATARK